METENFLKKDKSGVYSKTRTFWRKNFNNIFSRSKIDESFWEDLEESLISSDINVSITMELIDYLRDYSLVESINDPKMIISLIRQKFVSLFKSPTIPLIDADKKIILIIGVNGSGKTTTIAKLSKYITSRGFTLSIAAADTFRAAAKEQIMEWGEKFGYDVFSSSKSSDPSAVVYDAINSAKSKGSDYLLIDTAGRLHTSNNLMEEISKLYRTIQKYSNGYKIFPILIMDGTVGQNGITQAQKFNSIIPCNAVIMTKMDGSSKGGALISISNELDLPVIFIGVGESIDDLIEFKPEIFVDNILPNI